MNTLKEKPWKVLVISLILQRFGEVVSDAHSVYLAPSPFAEVKEGDNLTLNCFCDGSNTPDFTNWYLNNDTLGLVIEPSSCSLLTTPPQYEINRYSISCHGTKFTLSIASISKDKDHQDTWECDTTVKDINQHDKASTTIVVIDAGKDGQFDEPKKVRVTLICVLVSTAVVLICIAAAGYFLYRKIRNDICIAAVGYVPYGKRRIDCVKTRANNDHDEEKFDKLVQVICVGDQYLELSDLLGDRPWEDTESNQTSKNAAAVDKICKL